jgi:type VI secretion system protein ImpM
MEGGFGAFGKIPAIGDFLRLGLPDDFVAAWDDWAQRALLAARETLGSRWREAYLRAPIWRFTLTGGLAGRAAMLGVLTPSADRVGRLFPLTLAAPLPAGRPATLAHFLAADVFAALEAAALDALEDTMTRDALAGRLAALDLAALRPARPVARRAGGLSVTGSGPDDPLPDLASALVEGAVARPSLWSGNVGPGVQLVVCDGLPDAAAAAGLFDAPAARGVAAGAA